MFRKATFLSLFLFVLGVGLLTWQLRIISEKDIEAYRELASFSNFKSAELKGEPYCAKQERSKIVKEFYLEDDKGEKKLVKLYCQSSSLCYEQKEKTKEIVERMSDASCLMQEEVYALLENGDKVYKMPNGQFPEDLKNYRHQIMQTIQRIRSKQADYHYQTQVLNADQVIVERFLLPGKFLPADFEGHQASLSCKASHISLTLNKGLSFQAEDVDAHFLHNQEPVHIKAKSASYANKQLHLEGNVQLTFLENVVTSQIAHIQTDDQSRISSIQLQNNIICTMKDGGLLKAAFAAIDCNGQKSFFTGHGDAKVCYQRQLPSYFWLESRNMSMEWDAKEPKQISSLVAEQDVAIAYGKNIQAFGDYASYTGKEIILKTLHRSESCKVIHNGDNHLFADCLVLFPLEQKASFINPQGFINSQEGKILFSSKLMQWDEQKSWLTLSENVIIEEPSFGILKTDRSTSFRFKEIEGKKQISKIDCDGESFFVHKDDKNETHTLSTAGKISIDHEKKMLFILSKEGEKLTYRDHHGHIMANTGCLYYGSDENKIVPKKLFLEGDICIVNQFAAAQGSLAQYVLADLAHYVFENKELTLAQLENRVLFYDKINQIELSAPSLKIKRDAISEKDSIRGIGDVRFVFAAQELEKIKKRFKFNDPEDKEPSS